MAEFSNLTAVQARRLGDKLGMGLSVAEKRDVIRAVDALLGEILTSSGVDTRLDATELAITNLNAWAIALATKLNADAGVTDTNYDTTPQA